MTLEVVKNRSLRMIPSNVDAIMEKSRVRLAWDALLSEVYLSLN